MFTVLLVVHVLVTLALIGAVLIQRSEGGGLGIGGGQGMGSFMTGRGTANLLTRTTAILATVFLALSLVLALMSRGSSGGVSSIFNPAPASTMAPSTMAPLAPPKAPSKPAVPATPSTP
jgi:preprotein translocase subunit SecG